MIVFVIMFMMMMMVMMMMMNVHEYDDVDVVDDVVVDDDEWCAFRHSTFGELQKIATFPRFRRGTTSGLHRTCWNHISYTHFRLKIHHPNPGCSLAGAREGQRQDWRRWTASLEVGRDLRDLPWRLPF